LISCMCVRTRADRPRSAAAAYLRRKSRRCGPHRPTIPTRFRFFRQALRRGIGLEQMPVRPFSNILRASASPREHLLISPDPAASTRRS
jgi:hypothetical protein